MMALASLASLFLMTRPSWTARAGFLACRTNSRRDHAAAVDSQSGSRLLADVLPSYLRTGVEPGSPPQVANVHLGQSYAWLCVLRLSPTTLSASSALIATRQHCIAVSRFWSSLYPLIFKLDRTRSPQKDRNVG